MSLGLNEAANTGSLKGKVTISQDYAVGACECIHALRTRKELKSYIFEEAWLWSLEEERGNRKIIDFNLKSVTLFSKYIRQKTRVFPRVGGAYSRKRESVSIMTQTHKWRKLLRSFNNS